MRRRLAAVALYRQHPVCFACGRPAAQPCPGHEYGGTILAYQARRWTRLLTRYARGRG